MPPCMSMSLGSKFAWLSLCAMQIFTLQLVTAAALGAGIPLFKSIHCSSSLDTSMPEEGTRSQYRWL